MAHVDVGIHTSRHALQHTATHCNTFQQCDTLQHAATHCSSLQHTRATGVTAHVAVGILMSSFALQHTAPHFDTATHCNTLQHSATHCNTLHDISQQVLRHMLMSGSLCRATHMMIEFHDLPSVLAPPWLVVCMLQRVEA